MIKLKIAAPFSHIYASNEKGVSVSATKTPGKNIQVKIL